MEDEHPDLVAELEAHGVGVEAGPQTRRQIGRAQHAIWQLTVHARDAQALGDIGQAQLFEQAAHELHLKLVLDLTGGFDGGAAP